MAPTKTVAKKAAAKDCTCDKAFIEFQGKVEGWLKQATLRILELEDRVTTLEAPRPSRPSTINRVELGEVEPEVREDSNMKMGFEDKIISMTNAVKILPPNFIKDGRHKKEDVQAICGFIVTDEMMDDVYANFTHEA
jgi:hypothetical protein